MSAFWDSAFCVSALRTPHSALRTPRFYDSPIRHLAAGVRNHLPVWVNSILQQLNSGNFDSGSQDSVFYRVESVYNTVARFDGVIAIDDNIVNYLVTLLPPHTRQKCYSLAIVVDRNMCVVAQEQLEFLIEGHFSVPEISKLLGVSTRTVERRMTEYGLNIRQSYGQINDSNLDGVLNGILKDFPNSGYKRMTGLLLARGIRLQQSRIRSAMQRVNPEGCLLRSLELNVLHRRSYQVYGPLTLWYIDGNHKLIRYANLRDHDVLILK